MKKSIVLVFGLLILGALATLRWSVTAEPVIPPPARVESMENVPYRTHVPVSGWAPAERGHRLEGEGFVATAEAEHVMFAARDGWLAFGRGRAVEVCRAGGAIERVGEDGIVERYDPIPGGVEQSFVIPSRPEGDFVMEGALVSSLPAREIEDGVAFGSLVYRKAVAVDAAGRRLALAIEYAAPRVRIAIPASWLATAAFPVILDPVIGVEQTADTAAGESTDDTTANSYSNRGLAWDSVASRYAGVWSSAASTGNNKKVRFARFNPDGSTIGGAADLIPASALRQTRPHMAYGAGTFLAAYEERNADFAIGTPEGHKRIMGVFLDSNGAIGAPFAIGDEPGINEFPQVAFSPATSRFLVVWSRFDASAIVRARYVGATGLMEPAFDIGPASTLYSSALGYAGGHFLIGFADPSAALLHEASGVITPVPISSTGVLGVPVGVEVAANDSNPNAPEFLLSYAVFWLNGSPFDFVTKVVGHLVKPGQPASGPLGTGGTHPSILGPFHQNPAYGNADQCEMYYATVYSPGAQVYAVANNYLTSAGNTFKPHHLIASRIAAGGTVLQKDAVLVSDHPEFDYNMALAAGPGSEALLLYYEDGEMKTRRFDLAYPNMAGNVAPAAPAGVGASAPYGGPAVPPGGSVGSGPVVFKGTIADPNAGQKLFLQLEIKPQGTPFIGKPDAESRLGGGGQAQITHVLTPGTYEWQVRAMDEDSVAGPWVSGGSLVVLTAPSITTLYRRNPVNNALTSLMPVPQVKLQASVTSPDAPNNLMVLFEIRTVDAAFVDPPALVADNVNYFMSDPVSIPAGSTSVLAEKIAGGLVWQEQYHFRAIALASATMISAWKSYGTNSDIPPAGMDFRYDNVAPTLVPATVQQYQADGVTTIAVGGTVGSPTAVVKAELHDQNLPAQTIRLHVEVRPISDAFVNPATPVADGLNYFLSAPVNDGGVAEVALTPLTLGTSYHWRARPVDSLDQVGGWYSFGGNAETSADFIYQDPSPVVTSVSQLTSTGASMSVGQSVTTVPVQLRGYVNDPDAGEARTLQVEVRPIGQSFTGVATAESAPVTTNGYITVSVSALTFGTSYHWQARAVDAAGNASAWKSYATNAETAVDFSYADFPSAPNLMTQRRENDTAISSGGGAYSSTVQFRARTTDPTAPDTTSMMMHVQVEARPVGQAFTGAAMFQSTTPAPAGSTTYVYVTATGLSNAVSYHWQARAVREADGVTGPWLSYGSNPDPDGVDFYVDTVPPQTTITTAPEPVTTSTAAAFTYASSEPTGAAFSRRLDGGAWTGFSTLTAANYNVAAGTHVFQVRARDAAQGIDPTPATHVWTVQDPAGQTPPGLDPTAMAQADAAGPLAVGATTSQTTLTFSAPVFDGDAGAQISLQVELKKLGDAFNEIGLATGLPVGEGQIAQVIVPNVEQGFSYHWRARATDGTNVGTWTAFGENAETDADAIVESGTNVDVSLAAGWNLVCPAVEPIPATASALAAAIDAQNGAGFALKVQRWTGSQWQTFDPALPFTDFALSLGQAYFVRATGAGTWSTSGASPASVPVSLSQGFNGVGVPYAGMTAASLKTQIDTTAGAAIATKVQAWTGSQWQTYDPALPFTDFALSAGRGYFVETAAAGNASLVQP